MDTLIFATNNPDKVKEVRSILKNQFEVLSLTETGLHIDIPEPYDTLEQNACEKARVVHTITNSNCFGEDTGLEVDALNGEPGVKSARYAGSGRSAEENVEKLLTNLKDNKNRKAQFKTVLCIVYDGKQNIFEGICKGEITEKKYGESGFGYDPVFIPEGADKTFAEMTLDEKNIYSHRKKAFQKLIDFLDNAKQ